MLTIEMKVNGTVIGQIYAHCGSGALGLHEYPYHCYIMDTYGEPSLIKGSVSHQRQSGFLVLMEKLVTDINGQRGGL